MIPGRKPKPIALKLLEGNRGKRRLDHRELKLPRGIPDPPAHLSEDVRRVWLSFAMELKKMGVLTNADRFALEQLCENYQEILDHREALKKNGGRYQTLRMTNGSKKKFCTPHSLHFPTRSDAFAGC